MTRHEYGWIHQYYHYNGQPRETVLTDIAEADVAFEQEKEEAKEPHQAGGRRQRIRDLDFMFKSIPVPRGTQQATAMETVRDRARDREGAVEAWSQGLEACPDSPQLLKGYGRICRQLGREDEARRAFARALEVDPGDEEAAELLGRP